MRKATAPAETKVVVRMPSLLEWQKTVDRSEARFKVVCVGRRGGKTRYGVQRQARLALYGKKCWWIAPSYKLARVAWRSFRNVALQLPHLFVIRETDKVIETRHGFVEVRSSDDPSTLRSEGLDDATLDEHAFGKDSVWSQSIRPALTDRKGSALFISTPWGKNHFHKLYQRALADTSGVWNAFHFPSSANPFLDPGELEDARLDLTEREYRQEYLAEFLEDGGEVFRYVHEAASLDMADDPEPGHSYVGGIDWGRLNDRTWIVIGDPVTKEIVYCDRFTKIDYALQKARVRATHDRFKVTRWSVESNSMGGPLIEDLQRSGIPIEPFDTTAQSKPVLIENLALAFENRLVKIPRFAPLVGELESYEMSRAPSGAMRYSAPPGAHDDAVIATALCWRAMSHTAIRASVAPRIALQGRFV